MTRDPKVLPDQIVANLTDVAIVDRTLTIWPDKKTGRLTSTSEVEPPIIMNKDTSPTQRRRFYEETLRIPWLAPKVRDAILVELGKSVGAEKAKREEKFMANLRTFIAYEKKRMTHDEALASVAKVTGFKTVSALVKRLQRHKRRTRKVVDTSEKLST